MGLEQEEGAVELQEGLRLLWACPALKEHSKYISDWKHPQDGYEYSLLPTLDHLLNVPSGVTSTEQ